ncbi:Pr6Pr family membrane protein [Hyphobacterium sp.]|uniref:Pr6Pr family membrane protein n=1 Tax=Hyphobacterium sp. TaxID=2004662 RepID=UPI003BA9FA0C
MTVILRGVIAGIALAAVLVQYAVFAVETELDFVTATVRYFSFFTIWTNLLVAMGLGANAFFPNTAMGKFFGQDHIRTAVTAFIVVVGIVYHLLLAADHDPVGISAVLNHFLHTIVPAIVFLEWLFNSGTRDTRFVQVISWQVYPVLYTIYTLIKGAVTGFYPYPFLDVNTLGYLGVAQELVGQVIGFVVMGLILVAIGRLQARLMR